MDEPRMASLRPMSPSKTCKYNFLMSLKIGVSFRNIIKVTLYFWQYKYKNLTLLKKRLHYSSERMGGKDNIFEIQMIFKYITEKRQTEILMIEIMEQLYRILVSELILNIFYLNAIFRKSYLDCFYFTTFYSLNNFYIFYILYSKNKFSNVSKKSTLFLVNSNIFAKHMIFT